MAATTTIEAPVDIEEMLLDLQSDPTVDQIDLLFDCDLARVIDSFDDGGDLERFLVTDFEAFTEELTDAVMDDMGVRFAQLNQACEEYVLDN